MKCLLLSTLVMLGGCAITDHCDKRALLAEVGHISHPTAGKPFFGPGYEEDTLDYGGFVGRCTVGKMEIDTTLGYKYDEGGFYGPRVIGGIRVGYTLWSN